MSKAILIILVTVTAGFGAAFGQLKFYEDTYNGGVTAGGWSPTYSGSGTGNFVTNVTAGSTIRRAYLLAGRLGNAPDVTVTLNAINYTFNAGNAVTGPFTTIYGGPSGVHAIDVTADIIPAINNYSLTVPAQNNVSNRYQDFKLVVFYDNAALAPVNGVLFLNTFDLNIASNTWTLNFTQPIDNSVPVALSFFNSYQCNMAPDCENITVNGTYIGATGLNDVNSGFCGGTLGNFWYENNTLGALSDDIINQGVNQGDALSNSQAIIPNNSTVVTVLFEHCGGGGDNHQWTITVAYGGGVVLPLELLNFNAKILNEEEVKVDWTVASEHQIMQYIVERSLDGENWQEVAQVEAANKPNVETTYSLVDVNPKGGFSYYRLLSVDENGSRESHTQVAVHREDIALTVNVFPNPAKDVVNIIGQNGNYTFTLYNVNGDVVVNSTQPQVDISALPDGIYFYRVEENGSPINSGRLIVVD